MTPRAPASRSAAGLEAFTNPLRMPEDGGPFGLLDASGAPLTVSAGRESVELAPGRATEMLAYRVEHGGAARLNPTIKVEKGTTLALDLRNELEEGETVALESLASEQVYTFHCHILEHEEAGMMVNVRGLEPGRHEVVEPPQVPGR